MTVSNTYRSIYQPGNINDKSLIFAYPFLIDKSLQGKYGEVLRDFFSIQFINQIKESSIINITTSAVGAGGQYTTRDNIVNPAESLARSMGALGAGSTKEIRYDADKIDKREYQDKLQQFQSFIQNQIHNDPRYTDLNPVVSSVTVENLLDVPLILGTKQYAMESNVLFWMVFLATGALSPVDLSSIELNDKSAIDELKKVMFKLNKNNYNDYFGKSSHGRAADLPQSNASLNPSDFLPPDKFARGLDQLNYALDANQWAEQISINSTNTFSVSVNKTISDNPHLKTNVINNAKALFTGLFAADVMPLIQSIVHISLGTDEINYSEAVNTASKRILNEVNSMFTYVISSIETAYEGKNESETDHIFSRQETMCEINGKIAVGSILDKFKVAYFSMTGSKADFYKFVENLNTSGLEINLYVEQLITHIAGMGANGGEARITSLLNTTSENIRNIFDDLFLTISPRLVDNDGGVADHINTRINAILGTNNFNLSVFISNSISSLTSISRFLGLYVFFSYNCEYLSEIKAKVEVARNTAIQFPNYCLVLPATVVYKVYMAMAIADLKARRADPTVQGTLFKVNEQYVMNMVRTLSQRLKIPNIIVVDEKANCIYYRWMFHNVGFFAKLNIGNLTSYVSSQKNILTPN